MPEYTLYVDVWFLHLSCNFVFEYLLLWATANVTQTTTKPLRLALGALVGTLHYLFYLLASLGLIPFYGLLRFLPVIILLSLAMIVAAFYPLRIKRLASVCAHFYAIGFLAAGAGVGGSYLLGGPNAPHFLLGMVISMLTILIISELGWGIVHKRLVSQVYQIPLEIICEKRLIKIRALVDTGNNLRDPLNQQPVIIVEKAALNGVLPPEIDTIVSLLEQGQQDALEHLAAVGQWQTRLRIIPFSSIGKKNGILVGFRPDGVRIGNGAGFNTISPTIAIHPYSLDPAGEYAALVPPVFVEYALGSAPDHLVEGGTSYGQKPTSRL
ncbi:MAG: sigma-E processing peptidase SpoIIGA [Firmicutes bacterium]|nr:sigma-E processing peptidase SpoIIGA [Bacillota bacterium]